MKNDHTNKILNGLTGRVRQVAKRLLVQDVLKVIMLCLLFVVGFVLVYSWLDHMFNFEVKGRVISLAILILGLVYQGIILVKILIRHLSCSQVANVIDSHCNYDQQLVAAIEYYENQDDYPYSKELAQHLVNNIHQTSQKDDFKTVVPPWRSFTYSSIIALSVCVAGAFLFNNVKYFNCYFNRLANPIAVIAPLPPTYLELVTDDITVGIDEEIQTKAIIHGRLPEDASIVIEKKTSVETDVPQTVPFRSIALGPAEENEQQTLEYKSKFEVGRYRYRFQGDQANTDWKDINICGIPDIEEMHAKVSVPSSKTQKPYIEKIKNSSIDVTPSSLVTLKVKTTEKLDTVDIKYPDGRTVTKDVAGNKEFSVIFPASKEGMLSMQLKSSEGIKNTKLPPLQIRHKVDHPAKIKLISPQGDYLATAVSSVPITFEAKDEIGLEELSIMWELNGQPMSPIAAALPDDCKKHTFTHIIEMEDYDLETGDTIIYYAMAKDVDMGLKRFHKESVSDIYFIEIRTYSQDWFQNPPPKQQADQKPKGPNTKKPKMLLDILEYNRAFIKKTWPFSNQRNAMNSRQKAQLNSIADDVEFAHGQLDLVGDIPELNFTDEQYEAISEIMDHYEHAGTYLKNAQAKEALVHEKVAYQKLRKLVDEKKKLCPPGSGTKPDEPDKVKMAEKPHLKRFDQEKLDWEMQKIANEIEQIEDEQAGLQRNFEHFLANQKQKNVIAQKVNDELSASPKAQDSNANSKASPSSNNKSVSQDLAKPTVEGGEEKKATGQKKGKQGQGKQGESGKGTQGKSGQGQEGQSGNSQPGKSSNASEAKNQAGQSSQGKAISQPGQGGNKTNQLDATKAQMAMMQARQNILSQRVKQIQKKLDQISKANDNQPQANADSMKKTQGSLDQAMNKMDNAQNELAQAKFKAGQPFQKSMSQVKHDMGQASENLKIAKNELDSIAAKNQKEKLATKSQEMAEELANMADAFAKGTSPQEKREMLEALKKANAFMKQMMKNGMVADPNSSNQSKTAQQGSKGGDDKGSGFSQSNQRSLYGQSGGSLSPGVMKNDADIDLNSAETLEEIELLANKFWTIAIQARKVKSPLIDQPQSDAEYYELENEFFEQTAGYKK
ncbi:MAG: hypothetical protein JEZ07_18595 [Phycisphaerae bacterium]|nr:hypothetical protein [Phycisphaerae bacterium]